MSSQFLLYFMVSLIVISLVHSRVLLVPCSFSPVFVKESQEVCIRLERICDLNKFDSPCTCKSTKRRR